MKAIILAAGYATRLYPLTKDRPKPLLKIGGKELINYIMEQIELIAAIDEVYIVANDKFAEHFEKWAAAYDGSKRIAVLNDGSVCNDTRRGAIGGIKFCIDEMKIDDEVLIVCGDNLFTFSLPAFYEFYRKVGDDAVCAKFIDDIELLKRFAVATVDENKRITDFVEKPPVPASNLAVYGVYFYTKDTLHKFQKYLDSGGNPDAPGNFPAWLYKQKPVYCYQFEGECFDIGTAEAYHEINEIISSLKFY